MRRRKLLAALAGLAVVVAVGAVGLWPQSDRVTREIFDRLRVGMPRAEVEAILGPPGDNSTRETVPDFDERGAVRGEKEIGVVDPGLRSELRENDRAVIRVDFDPQGNLSGAWWGLVVPLDRSPLDNLLWRAKRQWHRWFP